MSRPPLTRAFLWIAVVGWGVGFGAKLFDLLVLGTSCIVLPANGTLLLDQVGSDTVKTADGSKGADHAA